MSWGWRGDRLSRKSLENGKGLEKGRTGQCPLTYHMVPLCEWAGHVQFVPINLMLPTEKQVWEGERGNGLHFIKPSLFTGDNPAIVHSNTPCLEASSTYSDGSMRPIGTCQGLLGPPKKVPYVQNTEHP